MLEGILYFENFIEDAEMLFSVLNSHVDWDTRMNARKTASYGVAYNYSQIHYPDCPMLPSLLPVIDSLKTKIGFCPNNCLINFYEDGKSRMGFHADQTNILEAKTGIAIVSLGEERIFRFRNIADKEQIVDFRLSSGSLFYMTQEVQSLWQHAIPAMDTEFSRMSLTFRKIKC